MARKQTSTPRTFTRAVGPERALPRAEARTHSHGSEEQLKDGAELFLLSIAEKVPMSCPQLWVRAVFHPREVFAEQSPRASLRLGLNNIITLTLIYAAFMVLVYFFMLCGIGIVYLPIAILSLPVIAVFFTLFWLMNSTLLYLWARILGGPGSFRQIAYLSAISFGSFGVVLMIVMSPMAFPIFGYCYSCLSYPLIFAGFTFMWYLNYLALRQTTSLTAGRALAAAILSFMCSMALIIGMYAGLYAAVIALQLTSFAARSAATAFILV